MLVNTNNHALDGGPATWEMEKEVVRDLAAMFGLPDDALGHLTASGTIANLEALWVARELHPGKAVAYSEDAHYTHARMCGVLGMEGRAVAADRAGRIDLDALEAALRGGGIGTVVLTPGTTGARRGRPDRRGAGRCASATACASTSTPPTAASSRCSRARGSSRRRRSARSRECDSVVVDPHKHGLQPYGCGAVLFRDPGVGPPVQARLALHLLHLRASCTSARSAWSARAPAPPRRRCG